MADKPNRSENGWTAGIPHCQTHAQSTRQSVCSTLPAVDTVLGRERQNRTTFQKTSSINYAQTRLLRLWTSKHDVRTVTFEPDPVWNLWPAGEMSRDWLMFSSSPFPVATGIVLPGNCLWPFFDCFGSVANLRWPCLLSLISRCSFRTKRLTPCKMNENYIKVIRKASCSRCISKLPFPGKRKLRL